MRTLAFLGLLLSASMAHATSARQLSLSELVKGSDATLVGHTIRSDSFWQGPRIYTLFHVAVDEVWVSKKALGPTVDILTMGGIVGNIGQRVDGAAALPPHNQVVLHLAAGTTGEYSAYAMGQGVWVISPEGTVDARISRPYVDRLVTGLVHAAPLPTTLAQLKRAVLEAANGP